MSFTSPKNPNVLRDHMASTCALLQFHFQYIEIVRTVEMKNKLFGRMCSLTTTVLQCQHALSMHPFHLESISELTKVTIFISAHGEVCNFIYALKKTATEAYAMLLSQFGRTYTFEHVVQQSWEHLSEVVPLSDLFAFTALGARMRKTKKLKVSSRFNLLLLTLRSDLIDFMSCAIETFIMNKAIEDSRFTVGRALPAVRRKSLSSDPRCEENRPNSRVQVDPESIWKLFVAAQNAGTSLRQALKLKKEDIGGAGEGKAVWWTRKLGVMYNKRIKTTFRMLPQLNMVADASTHSSKEILVSVLYSAAANLGGHAIIQHVKVGNLKPSDLDISVMVNIAKKNKIQRMAAYRQLQAIDHQLKLATDWRLNLDVFAMNLQTNEDGKRGDNEDAQPKKKSKRRCSTKIGAVPMRDAVPMRSALRM